MLWKITSYNEKWKEMLNIQCAKYLIQKGQGLRHSLSFLLCLWIPTQSSHSISDLLPVYHFLFLPCSCEKPVPAVRQLILNIVMLSITLFTLLLCLDLSFTFRSHLKLTNPFKFNRVLSLIFQKNFNT